jgi:DNA-directed RNA polymerase subunit H (RpoH/RPB5)
MTVAELIEKRALIVKRTQLPKISASEGIASIWPWNGDC